MGRWERVEPVSAPGRGRRERGFVTSRAGTGAASGWEHTVTAHPHVLIADDHPSHLKLMELLASREGLDVVALEHGKAVLEHLKHNTPALLVLDVDMPHVSGIDICARVRGVRRLAAVPVVLVSAQPRERVADQAPWVKADAVFEKPLRFDPFRATLRRLLARPHAA